MNQHCVNTMLLMYKHAIVIVFHLFAKRVLGNTQQRAHSLTVSHTRLFQTHIQSTQIQRKKLQQNKKMSYYYPSSNNQSSSGSAHSSFSTYSSDRRDYNSSTSNTYYTSTHCPSHTTNDPSRHRDVSPPRSHAEHPRKDICQYPGHRNVSPLGHSRFEQPSSYCQKPMQSLSIRQVYEATSPHRSHDQYQGMSDSAILSRSNAVRGRANDRGFGVTGYSSGNSDVRHVAQKRCDANFSRGGFSDWERY
jgi:hypothetical protein